MTDRLDRRQFLGRAALAPAMLGLGCAATGGGGGPSRLVVSTWDFGGAANAAAWAALEAGCEHPLDACEAGVRSIEADPSVTSVGYGGTPNTDGVVQLDASVMRGDTLECGGVAALEDVVHAVSVARRVMEATPHVLLVGDGARRFALEQGFETADLTTPASRERYARWRAGREGAVEPWEDHDTIGMIVRDGGRLGSAVTTSGLAWKRPGRVGDSPLIGAGNYCDDAAGAAVATGVGEEMIRSCACFAVVEAMRRGARPGEACVEVLGRVRRNLALRGVDRQVAVVAVSAAGETAGAALRAGFEFAVTDASGTRIRPGEVLR